MGFNALFARQFDLLEVVGVKDRHLVSHNNALHKKLEVDKRTIVANAAEELVHIVTPILLIVLRWLTERHLQVVVVRCTYILHWGWHLTLV